MAAMRAKRTAVELETSGGRREKFEITHAERILRMPNNGGWHLPKNSKYTFSKEHGFGFTSDTQGNSRAEEAAGGK